MNYRFMSFLFVLGLQSGLSAMHNVDDIRQAARQRYLAQQQSEKARKEDEERAKVQEQEQKKNALAEEWQAAIQRLDLEKMYALMNPIVKQGILSKEKAQELLEQKTKECAFSNAPVDDQVAKIEVNPLHAVTITRLQGAMNDQERAQALLDACERFVKPVQSESFIVKSVDDALAPLVVEPDKEKLMKASMALITEPIHTAIKGALDPEGNLLSLYYRYGLWRPWINFHAVTVPMALQWLNELIDRTVNQGKPVTEIINLCQEKLQERPIAFNLAAACLYHRLIVPLKAKKRTNIIVQLSEAHLFEMTPYFEAVEEAAKPDERIAQRSTTASETPGVTTTTTTTATATHADEQEDLGQQIYGLFQQALVTGNIETAELLHASLIASGMPASVLDKDIAKARKVLGNVMPVQSAGEVPDADTTQNALRDLYNRAVAENDLAALQSWYQEFLDGHVAKDDLDFQIARIKSLSDNHEMTITTTPSIPAVATTKVEIPTKTTAVAPVTASTDSWWGRMRSTISDPAVLSAFALGVIATSAYLVRR